MSFLAIAGSILIMAALVLYSFGVWGEKFSGTIFRKHITAFWTGLTCDTIGTIFMMALSESFMVNLHSITGFLALLLMAFHAIWATVVYRGDDEERKRTFHKYSLMVWIFWLIPFFSGLVLAMNK